MFDCEVEPPLTEMAPEEEEEEPHKSFASTSATCFSTRRASDKP